MRQSIGKILRNDYLMLIMGIVICIDSFGMVWHVFYENFLPMNWDTHHSMMALGLFHVLRAVANILDSFDKVAKRQEIIKDSIPIKEEV